MSSRARTAKLFLVSFTILFLEILLIRWVPAEVRAISYFKNFLLMAAFLGTGIGCLVARRRVPLGWLFPVGTAAVVGAAVWFAEQRVVPDSSQETLVWLLYFDLSPEARRWGIETVSILFFALTALPFVGLGKMLGETLAGMPALPGYTVNILASLCGTLAFAGLSAVSSPPLWWFAVLAGAGVLASFDRPLEALVAALVLGGLLVPVSRLDRESRWSPYYKIDRVNTDLGFSLSVNNSFHQHALPLGDARHPKLADLFQRYSIWYDFKAPERVLVLGAGTGNDVAVALARGAKVIDAVEIDPLILELGAEHPSRPYAAPGVTCVNQDARRFLRDCDGTYDLIVFGTLDSQTVLAGTGSVRLDSFMYTRECFAAVKARLAPDGVMAVYYSAGEEWLVDKLHATIRAGFGYAPLKHLPPPRGLMLFSVVFLAGEPIRVKYGAECEAEAAKLPPDVEVPTDDWPNLYLRRRGVPSMYLWSLAGVLLLSGVAVPALLPRGRRRPLGFYFFMGAAFLLLETKSISDLALLFGATWTVNVFVISAILSLILAANLVAGRWPRYSEATPLARRGLAAGLVGSLLLGWAFPPARAYAWGGGAGSLTACAIGLAPLAVAALLYAWVYRDEPEPDRAFGSNLLGAMLGGVLEYGAMVAGLRALSLAAVALYAGAMVCAEARRTRVGAETA